MYVTKCHNYSSVQKEGFIWTSGSRSETLNGSHILFYSVCHLDRITVFQLPTKCECLFTQAFVLLIYAWLPYIMIHEHHQKRMASYAFPVSFTSLQISLFGCTSQARPGLTAHSNLSPGSGAHGSAVSISKKFS